jgi:hypothetical protein
MLARFAGGVHAAGCGEIAACMMAGMSILRAW